MTDKLYNAIFQLKAIFPLLEASRRQIDPDARATRNLDELESALDSAIYHLEGDVLKT